MVLPLFLLHACAESDGGEDTSPPPPAPWGDPELTGVVEAIQVDQLDVARADGSTLVDSSWGRVQIDATPGDTAYFLTVLGRLEDGSVLTLADAVPVPTSTDWSTGTWSMNGFVDLGVDAGTDVHAMELATRADVTPPDEPGEPLGWAAVTVAARTRRANGLPTTAEGAAGAPAPAGPSSALLAADPLAFVFRADLESSEQDVDQCVAGSLGDAFHWLADRYGLDLDGQTTSATQDELDDALDRDAGEVPAAWTSLVDAQLAYVADHGLPLAVRYVGWVSGGDDDVVDGATDRGAATGDGGSVTAEWLTTAIDDDATVELVVDAGLDSARLLAVSGYVRAGSRVGLTYAEDAEQGDDDAGTTTTGFAWFEDGAPPTVRFDDGSSATVSLAFAQAAADPVPVFDAVEMEVDASWGDTEWRGAGERVGLTWRDGGDGDGGTDRATLAAAADAASYTLSWSDGGVDVQNVVDVATDALGVEDVNVPVLTELDPATDVVDLRVAFTDDSGGWLVVHDGDTGELRWEGDVDTLLDAPEDAGFEIVGTRTLGPG